MNNLRLSLRTTWQKPLSTLMSMLLFAIGVSMVSLVYLFNEEGQAKIERNASPFSMVISAKGSPLQIVLASIFHADKPTGNIELEQIQKILKLPQFGSGMKIIPISVGDKILGYSLIGTELAYPEAFQAKLAQGNWWQNEHQVCIGAKVAKQTGLKIGDKVYPTHTQATQNQQEHTHEYPLSVVGILEENQTVLDRLILCAKEAIWEMHQDHASDNPFEKSFDKVNQNQEKHDHDHDAHDHDHDAPKEVSFVLLAGTNPNALLQLPALINKKTNMQALVPSVETRRLTEILGVSTQIITSLAWVLIVISLLSIFVALWQKLKENTAEHALIRLLGANKWQVFSLMMLQAYWIVLPASLVGILLQKMILYYLSSQYQTGIGAEINWQLVSMSDFFVFLVSILLGTITAFLPAIGVLRIPITESLE